MDMASFVFFFGALFLHLIGGVMMKGEQKNKIDRIAVSFMFFILGLFWVFGAYTQLGWHYSARYFALALGAALGCFWVIFARGTEKKKKF